MPPDRVLHMAVKFPLDMYVANLDADDDATRASTRSALVSAVKNDVVRCPGRDSNPHGSFEPGGFKPPVSANSTTRASSEG